MLLEYFFRDKIKLIVPLVQSDKLEKFQDLEKNSDPQHSLEIMEELVGKEKFEKAVQIKFNLHQ